MPNVLEVQIVGDLSGLEKSLKDAQKLQAEYTDSIKSTSDEIDKLNKQKLDNKKLGIDSAPLNKQISELQNKLVELRGELTKAGFASDKAEKSIAKLSNPIEEAGDSASDTAGEVADLVSPLLEAGGATQEVTEGANILASALSGGLAGAISSIVGYLVKMYVDAQNAALAIHEVGNEAVKSAGAEIASLNALVAVAKDENNSRAQRLAAVQKLQAEYPAYFGNLTKEQILNGNVENAVKAVTFALIQKSKAQILANKIAENDLKLLQLQQKGQKDVADFTAGKGLFAVAKGIIGQQLLKSSLDSTASAIEELKKENKEYTAELEKSTKVANAFEVANQNASKTTKAKKEVVRPKIEAVPELTIAKSTDDQNDKILAMFRDKLSEDISNLKTKPIDVQIPFQVIPENEYQVYLDKLKQAQEETKMFSDASGAAINALGSDLASSLATGNAALDAFVGSVIQGLAQVAAAQLTSLVTEQAVATGKVATNAAVSTSNAITAATSTAASTGPAAAFILPALVGAAIGFIAASFAGIKFAHGGVVPGGSFTGDKIPAMLNSGEAVLNSQQQANTLMAIANGNSNSLQGNIRSDNFALSTKIRGADLLLSVEREKRKR